VNGYEIFKDIARRICDRQKFAEISSGQLQGDLAEDVARWQSINERVPPELQALLAALRKRIGLS